jgi:hypothetical protein
VHCQCPCPARTRYCVRLYLHACPCALTNDRRVAVAGGTVVVVVPVGALPVVVVLVGALLVAAPQGTAPAPVHVVVAVRWRWSTVVDWDEERHCRHRQERDHHRHCLQRFCNRVLCAQRIATDPVRAPLPPRLPRLPPPPPPPPAFL